ncbi:MAG: phenylacetate--CoA ligase [Euryarchaeota archaeon]|nr:phenylacetate--CoA ligase [Euryarchaeota archaeon]
MEGKYWNKKIETMKLEDLRKLQLKRMKAVVKRVYENNAGYHKIFKDAGVKPGHIKTLDDVQKIPLLTKDELRKYYPFGLVCTPMNEIVELHASSGTTGKPVVGPYTRNDLGVWSEVMARIMYTAGIRKGDRFQNAFGYGLFTGAHGFEKGAQKIGSLVIPMSSGNTLRQLRLMKDFGTTALGATPSYTMYMAEVAEKEGYDIEEDFNLKVAMCGAEAWSGEMRKKIENKWGISAFDNYGLTEIIGPGVSVECEEHEGLHVNADHFYVEIIDPKTEEVLEPGEEGELVFTTLTKEAFPSIRFRTKDLSKLIVDECSCGRTLPRHVRIMGRADDMMKVRGVIVFPKQIEEAIMRVDGVSENYQIVKYKSGVMTRLRVKVEPDPAFKGDYKTLAERIQEEIYSILNLTVEVDIVEIGDIPRSTGKAKRVVEE